MTDLATASLTDKQLAYELAAACNGLLFAQTMEQRRRLMDGIQHLQQEQQRRAHGAREKPEA